MADERPPQGRGLLWVPIVTALAAAALLTLRSWQHRGEPSARSSSEPVESAREMVPR